MYISKHSGICIANNGYICLGENNKIGESIDLTAKNNSEIGFGNKVQVRRSGKIYACDFWGINIEKGTTFCKYLYMDSEKSQIYIGEDCMFSHYVKLNVGSHRLINKNDGTDITNPAKVLRSNIEWFRK